MKVSEGRYMDPETFETFGPVKVSFRWDIFTAEILQAWLIERYGSKGDCRLVINSDRMIKYPMMAVYLESEEAAMLFKLTFAGHESCKDPF